MLLLNLVVLCFVTDILTQTTTNVDRYEWDLLMLLEQKYKIGLEISDSDFMLNLTSKSHNYRLPAQTIFPNRMMSETLFIYMKFLPKVKSFTILTIKDPDQTVRFQIKGFEGRGQFNEFRAGIVIDPVAFGEKNAKETFIKSTEFTVPFLYSPWTIGIVIDRKKLIFYTNCEDTTKTLGYHHVYDTAPLNVELFKPGATVYLFNDGRTGRRQNKFVGSVSEFIITRPTRIKEFMCRDESAQGSGSQINYWKESFLGNVLLTTNTTSVPITSTRPTTSAATRTSTITSNSPSKWKATFNSSIPISKSAPSTTTMKQNEKTTTTPDITSTTTASAITQSTTVTTTLTKRFTTTGTTTSIPTTTVAQSTADTTATTKRSPTTATTTSTPTTTMAQSTTGTSTPSKRSTTTGTTTSIPTTTVAQSTADTTATTKISTTTATTTSTPTTTLAQSTTATTERSTTTATTTSSRTNGKSGKKREYGERESSLDSGSDCECLKLIRFNIPEKGIKGSKGSRGETGSTRIIGPPGLNGVCSSVQCQSKPPLKGHKGEPGQTGFCSENLCQRLVSARRGAKGDKGDIGQRGIKGEKGDQPTASDVLSVIIPDIRNSVEDLVTRNIKSLKGEPGSCNCNNGKSSDNRKSQIATMVMSDGSELRSLSSTMSMGQMVFLVVENVLLIKVDDVKNRWRIIRLEESQHDLYFSVEGANSIQHNGQSINMETQNSYMKRSYDNSFKLLLVALSSPTTGDLRSDNHEPGAYSGSSYQCQKNAYNYNLGRAFYPLINTDTFDFAYMIPEKYRYGVPIINRKNETIAQSFDDLIKFTTQIMAPILDFNGRSILSNIRPPCVWIGRKPTLYENKPPTEEGLCVNWMSRRMNITGTTTRLILGRPLLDQHLIEETSCRSQCYVLCMQIHPSAIEMGKHR